MDHSFGAGARRAEIVSTLNEARQAAHSAGIGSRNTSSKLLEAIQRFQHVQFDDTILAVRTLAIHDDVLAALPSFGRGGRDAVDAGAALASAAGNFLDAIDATFDMHEQDPHAKFSAIESSVAMINESLEAIEAGLLKMRTIRGEATSAT